MVAVGALTSFLGGVSGGSSPLSSVTGEGGLPQGGSATATGGNIGGDNKITPEGLRQEGQSGPRGVNINFGAMGTMFDSAKSINDTLGTSTLGLPKINLPVAILAVSGLLIGYIIVRKVR